MDFPSADSPSRRLVIITTVPVTAYAFLRGQLRALSAAGFDVTLITSPDPELAGFAAREGVRHEAIPISREISPLADLRSLIALLRALHRIHPDIVNAGTPKGGLLGMIAAWLCRTPVRVYHMRGLRMETAVGAKRTLLAWMERTAAACSQVVVCNGESLRRRFVELGLAPASKVIVLGSGTSNGLDVERFSETPDSACRAREIRVGLRIPEDSPIIGFVGRLTQDKGVIELVDAFELIQRDMPEVHLLLLGHLETGDPVPAAAVARMKANNAIHMTGFVSDPAPYYHVMDLLAFPSHREGFPNAPLEAAAAAKPTVGYRVTGVVDAVTDGITGLLVPANDMRALGNALRLLLENRTLRQQLGAASAFPCRQCIRPPEGLETLDRLLSGRTRFQTQLAWNSQSVILYKVWRRLELHALLRTGRHSH